uniref:B3 domain-containing transcription factor VAL3 n=1 Tax=Oryza meridionalis TaxID=40149 RepID=A0A0E0ED45_9ORYZ
MSSPAQPPPTRPPVAAPPPSLAAAAPISVQPPPLQPKPPPPPHPHPQQPPQAVVSVGVGPPPPTPQHQQQQQQQGPPGHAPPQQRPRICFNAHCKDPKSDGPRRRGWRLRNGDFAELCDRCYHSFEHGGFCETFHLEVAGWRNCESCGKRLHCGCIVSVHAFVHLDAGGVECVMCARKSHAAMAPTNGPKDHIRIGPTQQQQQMASSSLQKQFYSHSVIDNDFQAQLRNGRPRMDAKARSQLLPRYWPRITDQELQHLSGDSNSVITPLFEKMLSASDAGRIGRLVLPKKCAEAYFPAISQAEGLPLKVQDATGKEWVFQFRFWPNNNSRMYVLEGVTPCIQSMQLQAGDTVTFSRIDPEGKLVMGFRKATNLSAEQDQPTKPANGVPPPPEANNKVVVPDSSPNAAVPRPIKVNTESKSSSPVEQATACKIDKGALPQKEGPGTSSSSPLTVKRKATSVGPKIKRFRMDSEESMELKITWEEAQELLRPPPKAPSIVVVDGHEFEEYEEPPILGRRTYFVTDQSGENHQWAQCEDCSKWRKLPVDALLPSKWTCSDNKWDSERSSCDSAQEINMEELGEMIPIKPGAAKKTKGKVDTDNIDVSDGLDTLANLAILGEGESLPSQPTTRHPRHRPGCSCIVCIQPPSGKGPKHKQTCTCNVCMTVRRRFRTLMMRREKRQQSEKDSGVPRKREPGQSSEPVPQSGSGAHPTSTSSPPQRADTNGEGPEDMSIDNKRTSSPVKNQIDLNSQPEREDEQSPKSDATRLLRDNPT